MKNLFYLFLFCSFLVNAQSKKTYKIKKGDTEIEYNESVSEYSTYTKYESYLGENKDKSGALLEWKFDGVKQPISAYWISYHTKSYGNYFKRGERREYFQYTFINGELNGLQKVSMMTDKGFKNVWAMAVINGVLVGKQIIDKNNSWVRKSDWEAAYTVKTFGEGKKYNYSYGGGWMVDSFPENNYYNLEDLVKLFLEDFKALDNEVALTEAVNENNINNRFTALNLWEIKDLKIDTSFKKLDGKTIAISYGMNRNNEITIRVDPEKWENASTAKKWYILYHELGHDVLNLEHGQGGRMMFNFPTKEYTWEEFFKDRDFMFDYYLKKKYKDYAPLNRSSLDN